MMLTLRIALLLTMALLLVAAAFAGVAIAQEPPATAPPPDVQPDGIDPNGNHTIDIRPATPCGDIVIGFPCSALRCEEWVNPKLLDTYLLGLPVLGLLGLRLRRLRELPGRMWEALVHPRCAGGCGRRAPADSWTCETCEGLGL